MVRSVFSIRACIIPHSCATQFPLFTAVYILISGPGYLSRYTDSLGLDGSQFEIRWRKEPLSPTHPPRKALGPTQSPARWMPGLFQRSKMAWAFNMFQVPCINEICTVFRGNKMCTWHLDLGKIFEHLLVSLKILYSWNVVHHPVSSPKVKNK